MTAGDTRSERGVVAVIAQQGKLLVIERSQFVRAPGMWCFPGGGLEPGETEPEALVRELEEELSLPARPARALWTSVTPWNVSLSWWLAIVDGDADPQPNPAEVAACYWLSVAQMRRLPKLLASNLTFLAAWESGEFTIDGLAMPTITSRETAD